MADDPLDQFEAQLQAEIEMLLIRLEAHEKWFEKLPLAERRAHAARYRARYIETMEQVRRLGETLVDVARRRNLPD